MKIIKTLTAAALLLVSLSAAARKEKEIEIIPRPQSIEMGKGSFKVSGAVVNCDPALDARSREVVSRFATALSLMTGKVNSVATPTGIAANAKAGNVKGIVFYRDESLESEEYSIEVNGSSARIAASDFYGTLYAVQTLKQMLPQAIYGKKPAVDEKWYLPCVSIKDKPRFHYRGLHLDCSRHFFSLDEVKKYLDVMAMYKLNRFHWHLSDDQGWRIEIKQYPLLTEVGAYREGTCIGKDFGTNDGIRYGGYYTQDQVREIIAYADALGITIIPEIDLPGHMLAALTAYPELGCTGGPYAVWTRWGVSPQVLCPGKESTMAFLEDVLDEIADLFPSEYIHIGGDECPKTEWAASPECQAKIAELGLVTDEHATAEQRLQNYVTARMQQHLATRGKKIIGWDEILEGNLQPGATVMSWRGVAGGVEASARGFDVIMTPNTYCYIDYYQSEEKDLEPLAIGGCLPVEKGYGYDPLEGMGAEQAAHILGVQANLWTEYIKTEEHLEYMLLPRLLALSEVQWCAPENKDYGRFVRAVTGHGFKALDFAGYTYAKHLIGVSGDNIK